MGLHVQLLFLPGIVNPVILAIYKVYPPSYNALFVSDHPFKQESYVMAGQYQIKGFQFAGIHAGIKKLNGVKDLGLILCKSAVPAAAVFTRNRVKAAPVLLGEKVMEKGRCRAVLVNSGNANCFTGEQGMADAKACSRYVAENWEFPQDEVMVSSTGVIGAPLPMDRFETGIPALKPELGEDNLMDFAQDIITTDLSTKVVQMSVDLPDSDQTINMVGVAKGSGMIRPDMATMLAYVLTDAKISPPDLKKALVAANEKSFNRITVDGDTSTNDTLMCLASGEGDAEINDAPSFKVFSNLLEQVCFKLGKMIVKDGEGATKVIQIKVKGGKTPDDAFLAAEAIAHSNLVKTAIYGEDPNWGRITAAAGRSGAHVVAEKMDLYFGEQPLVLQGKWLGPDAEKKAAQIMKAKEIIIILDLNLGDHEDAFLFCDFSEDYVKINADYRS